MPSYRIQNASDRERVRDFLDGQIGKLQAQRHLALDAGQKRVPHLCSMLIEELLAWRSACIGQKGMKQLPPKFPD